MNLEYDDFLKIDEIGFLLKNTDLSIYDYDMRFHFDCTSINGPCGCEVVLRIGVVDDYSAVYDAVKQSGNRLLCSEEQHQEASNLEKWYPKLSGLTPRSRVYDTLPSLKEVVSEFAFPIFVKGNIQTSRHLKNLSIIENAEMYASLSERWNTDRILGRQKAVIRDYLPLRVVDDISFPDRIPASYEFRVFVWKGTVVSIGRYWVTSDYTAGSSDLVQIRNLALLAAKRLNVPFLVVDVAQTVSGDWIVIEVNDAQESGYAGNNPLILWNTVLGLEKTATVVPRFIGPSALA